MPPVEFVEVSSSGDMKDDFDEKSIFNKGRVLSSFDNIKKSNAVSGLGHAFSVNDPNALTGGSTMFNAPFNSTLRPFRESDSHLHSNTGTATAQGGLILVGAGFSSIVGA